MAAAFQLASSHVFEGNDGPWGTFRMAVGDVLVNVLPSSTMNYPMVIDSKFCTGNGNSAAISLSDCADLRGGVFNENQSSTFFKVANRESADGTFFLPWPYEERLYPLQCSSGCNNTGEGYFPNTSSLFGTDTIGFPDFNGNSVSLEQQLVAPFAGLEPNLGLIGLNSLPLNVSKTQPSSSPLQALWDQDLAPSRYWAYHAGSHAQNLDGSLTIGGYDRNRGDLDNAPCWSIDEEDQNPRVQINSISIEALSNANYNDSIIAAIDTTVPELWLPASACEVFESAFNLSWNDTLYMYLVSDDQVQVLRDSNPSVTFNLGIGDVVQTIRLSYNAFDLKVKWPLGGIDDLETTASYFPLKRATNAAQYTLGRAFFQEAYLGIDYDNSKFCLTPAPTQVPAEVDLVTVNSRQSSGLSTGAIAGIAVGGAAVLLAIVLLAWYLIRRRKKRSEKLAFAQQRESMSTVPGTYSHPHEEYYGKQEMDAKDTALPSPDPNKWVESPVPGVAEVNSEHTRSVHRRTLSGETIAMSPVSRGSGARGMSPELRPGLEHTQSQESQQIPSLHELEAHFVGHEMLGDLPGRYHIRNQ